jgi:predicted 3-demethylubiquinone-9 3-methyltransferase (glyoxalase superfamily)
MPKNTLCLWYSNNAEEAGYAKTFPNSTVGAFHRAPSDYPGGGKQGDVLTFTVCGVPCIGLNGGDGTARARS